MHAERASACRCSLVPRRPDLFNAKIGAPGDEANADVHANLTIGTAVSISRQSGLIMPLI
jgi:hypothetical protein